MKRFLEEKVTFFLISRLGLNTSHVIKVAANIVTRMFGLPDVLLTREGTVINIFFTADSEKKMTPLKMQKCPASRKTNSGIFFTDIPDLLSLYRSGKCFNAAPVA